MNDISRSNPISVGTDDSVPEEEWPSIVLPDQAYATSDQRLEDDPSEWPSISFDDEDRVNESTVSLDDLGDSLSIPEQHFEQSESGQTESLMPSNHLHEILKSEC